MLKRGKRSGYKGWIKKTIKEYELFLSKRRGRKIGTARIFRAAGKWYAEVQTDIKGLFETSCRSPPCEKFTEALDWLNKKRKQISKSLFD